MGFQNSRLKWLREIGIIDVIQRRWVPRKPPCEGSLGFNSIGITEVKPALMVLAFGFALSLATMLGEVICKYLSKYSNDVYKKRVRWNKTQ